MLFLPGLGLGLGLGSCHNTTRFCCYYCRYCFEALDSRWWWTTFPWRLLAANDNFVLLLLWLSMVDSGVLLAMPSRNIFSGTKKNLAVELFTYETSKLRPSHAKNQPSKCQRIKNKKRSANKFCTFSWLNRVKIFFLQQISNIFDFRHSKTSETKLSQDLSKTAKLLKTLK